MPSPDQPTPPRSDELILDARSMRVIAHPVRIRIMGILRKDGPQNSTSLAERLGLNTGATSYHLRQLADHGMIVEDTERGTGRERWWEIPTRSTRMISEDLDESALEESTNFLRALSLVYSEQMQRAIEAYVSEPLEWRVATIFSDYGFRLTAEEATQLISELRSVLDRYRAYDSDDERDDVEQFHVQLQAFRLAGF